MEKNKITVIGAGSWGCALARILGDNGHEVMIYDVDVASVKEINEHHTNRAKLKEGVLPLCVNATTDLKVACNFADNILLVVPTKVTRSVLVEINSIIKSKKLFINASKGIEPATFKRISEIVYEVIDNNKKVVDVIDIDGQIAEGLPIKRNSNYNSKMIEGKITSATSIRELLKRKKSIKLKNIKHLKRR